MNWASWSDFLAMGGHGAFVWGSYGVSAALLVLELLLLRRRQRQTRQAVLRRAQLAQRGQIQ